ncbi:MAG: hypothetical protein QXL94_00780 [Candidatus Parvarchaeum sp.]
MLAWELVTEVKNLSIYLVKSETLGSQKSYIVTHSGEEWFCTCADSLFRKHECKHIKMLKKSLEEKENYTPKE